MIKAPVSQAGRKCALLHKAVGPPFEPHANICGGGGADVEGTDIQRFPVPDRYGNPHVSVCHKCVLAARLQPERLTVN